MKGFDSDWLSAYENHARSSPQSSLPEPIVRHEPVAKKTGEEGHPKRIHVRVISYRKRLCDPDNLCPKYFIDCLRYAKIIPNDRPQDITLEVGQECCSNERTEITIEYAQP